LYTLLGHHFHGQKVKGQGHQAGLLAAAFTHRQLHRSAWERIERGKLLLRCRLQARRSARRREALRRPQGEEERGGAYRVTTRTAHIVDKATPNWVTGGVWGGRSTPSPWKPWHLFMACRAIFSRSTSQHIGRYKIRPRETVTWMDVLCSKFNRFVPVPVFFSHQTFI